MLPVLSARQFGYIVEFGQHVVVSAFTMGEQTIRAVLDTLNGIGKVAAAFVTQRIQRAVAKQAVKMLIVCFVAGEVFAVPILEIRKIIFHKNTSL